jgi:hypothetical protein
VIHFRYTFLANAKQRSNKMKTACELLECHKWPEERIATVCDVIVHHPELFRQNVIYCLQFTVIPKVSELIVGKKWNQ